MKLLGALLFLLLFLPFDASAARLVIATPPGITEVRLLSPGTSAMVDFLKDRLNVQLKASREKNRVESIEKELSQATTAITEAEKAYAERIEFLRKKYIENIHITIHSSSTQITPESALGDITFFYTAHNASDRIISDITYKPVIGDIALPITTSLVLEFINPKTLIFGLAPGERLSNQGKEPEHFSIFLSEIKDQDIQRIQSSMPGGFSVRVSDVHFVSQKGYKGQSRVMEVKEAFSGLLSSYQSAVQQARNHSRAKSEELARAKTLHERETSESVNEFRMKAYDLKKNSVRYKRTVDQRRNRSSMEPVEPGKYIVYAPANAGAAVFQEITVGEGTTKLKIETLKKDPFEP